MRRITDKQGPRRPSPRHCGLASVRAWCRCPLCCPRALCDRAVTLRLALGIKRPVLREGPKRRRLGARTLGSHASRLCLIAALDSTCCRAASQRCFRSSPDTARIKKLIMSALQADLISCLQMSAITCHVLFALPSMDSRARAWQTAGFLTSALASITMLGVLGKIAKVKPDPSGQTVKARADPCCCSLALDLLLLRCLLGLWQAGELDPDMTLKKTTAISQQSLAKCSESASWRLFRSDKPRCIVGKGQRTLQYPMKICLVQVDIAIHLGRHGSSTQTQAHTLPQTRFTIMDIQRLS